MGGVLARLGRAVRADDGAHHDQGGPGIGLGAVDGRGDGVHVLAVLDLLHVPAVGLVALHRVLAQGELDLALDGDVVAVIDEDELAQAQRGGQGARLAGDALHHAAVAHQAVGVVVHHREARAVELGGQVLFGHGHAHGVGNALAQRAGGRLHAHGVAVLRVAGGLGVELAEVLQVLDRQPISEQVQQRIEEHRRMARREHEPVAVAPGGVCGVVHHALGPDGVGRGRGAQRRARVAGVGLLDRVRRERTHRGDHLDIDWLHDFSSLSGMRWESMKTRCLTARQGPQAAQGPRPARPGSAPGAAAPGSSRPRARRIRS